MSSSNPQVISGSSRVSLRPDARGLRRASAPSYAEGTRRRRRGRDSVGSGVSLAALKEASACTWTRRIDLRPSGPWPRTAGGASLLSRPRLSTGSDGLDKIRDHYCTWTGTQWQSWRAANAEKLMSSPRRTFGLTRRAHMGMALRVKSKRGKAGPAIRTSPGDLISRIAGS